MAACASPPVPSWMLFPLSAANASFGSSGMDPRKGTPMDSHIAFAPPPPAGSTCTEASSCSDIPGSAASSAASTLAVTSSASPAAPSCGFARNFISLAGILSSLMFSTTPRTGNPTFLQKLISLRTSMIETCCGVVTMMAPSGLAALRYCTMEMCSSEVPGGVSTMRKSCCPQSTSRKNCLTSPFFRGPLQMTGSSWSGSMKPMDITPRLSST
mmetsp:Transcript_34399/g.97450  ORF Transcript_34399/g.97450 Transcript_34399/m.97450 type:complete len:213 (+) Transcript_34399:336-974(+)